MTYEVPESAPRRRCQACDAIVAFVASPKTAKIVPVNVATGESHYLDCADPSRFSRKGRLVHRDPEPAAAAPEGVQRGLFE